MVTSLAVLNLRNGQDDKPISLPITTQPSDPIVAESSNTQQGDEVTTETTIESGITLKSFKRTEVKNGQKLWELEAVKGKHIPESNQTFLDNPFLTIFDETGKETKVKALSATLHHADEGINMAELMKSVELISDDGTVLQTEYAKFFAASNTMEAPEEVTITNEKMKITGKELTANLTTKDFILNKDVKSIINPKEAK